MKIHAISFNRLPQISEWYQANFDYTYRKNPSLYIGIDNSRHVGVEYLIFADSGDVKDKFYIEVNSFNRCIKEGQLKRIAPLKL